MTKASFTNFFNNAQAFGLNVKSQGRTMQQIGKTAGDVAGGVLDPLLSYLEENENIFNGDVNKQLNKMRTANFNMELIMSDADLKTNGPKPTFDTKF